jgi:hypothetical protein
MKWTGKWRNEYGSILHIVDDRGGTIRGTFRTALGDSGFAGEDAVVGGLHRGPCLHFAFGRSGPEGDTVASFTGLMRDGKLKTVWHVVADRAVKPPKPGESPVLLELPWAHAVQTNADTFERIPD